MKSAAYKIVKPVINATAPLFKGKLLKTFQAMSPRISETEKQVLEIGDVGIEGDIYAGKIDWQALYAREKHRLSDEEKAFLEGPVEELCRMIDDYEVYEGKEQDIPQKAWDFIRENKFLGMIIPKQYGGLEFSALGHSMVIHKLASRNFTAAINVMVPNSLGPAELILHYGTEEQKEHWLPLLAEGKEIPCFGLTEPNVGSDATAIETTGTVKKDDDGKPYLHIDNVNKRYITLAPIATLIGLAVNVKDPDRILSDNPEPGITVALVKRDTPGLEIGDRHQAMRVPFQNGPIRCAEEGIKVPVEDFVVGGAKNVGKGWPMLVTLLSVGRGISLPSVSLAGMKMALRITGAYGRVRKQFGLPVGEFEGVKKHLGEMAGLTYIAEATRVATLRTIDDKKIPSVATAMVKYHLTENMRRTVTDAMDILGGKAVMHGPQNLIQRMYTTIPIGITVEGANIMTRNFMIFGQGSVRAHPYLLDEVAATENPNAKEGANQLWDLLMNKHIPNLLENADKAKYLGRKKPGNSIEGYKQQIERLSAAFNVAANISVTTIGAALKSKENLGARMGDVMSYLYMATCALEKFEDDGRPEADRPLVDWSCQWALEKAESALDEFIPNYKDYTAAAAKKVPLLRIVDMAKFLQKTTLPAGKKLSKPSDALTLKAADIILTPGEARDRLTEGVFHPAGEENNPINVLEKAFAQVIKTDPIEKTIRKAVKKGDLDSFDPAAAAKAGVISAEDAAALEKTNELVAKVVNVDHFTPAHFK
ncbi:MAG: acyl-CoA dehydrogenase [Rhodospirillales bacterium]|nr:acyl-CoA dehydrogenase [Rhodospirillales bacterium]